MSVYRYLVSPAVRLHWNQIHQIQFITLVYRQLWAKFYLTSSRSGLTSGPPYLNRPEKLYSGLLLPYPCEIPVWGLLHLDEVPSEWVFLVRIDFLGWGTFEVDFPSAFPWNNSHAHLLSSVQFPSSTTLSAFKLHYFLCVCLPYVSSAIIKDSSKTVTQERKVYFSL